MLGWEIFVERERDGVTLAAWTVGIDGLNWIHHLESQGLAVAVQQNGYPSKYIVKAQDVLPLLRLGAVPPHDSPEVLGDDYVLPPKFSAKYLLNESELDNCRPEDKIVIDAWDQS